MSAGRPRAEAGSTVTLALCGDVMTGRGIDQILAQPSDPILYEPGAGSALAYVELAEALHGPIPRRASAHYVWGDALDRLRADAALRIVNLETSVTISSRALAKGINYRMHPRNAGCLVAAGIDCCTLANNHVLDWGVPGLLETLTTLEQAGIQSAGAGCDATQAQRPALLPLPSGGRAIVVACGTASAGIPADWAAATSRPGINFLPDLSDETAARLGEEAGRLHRAGDIAIASLHWGPNWGYAIPRRFRKFAHALIDAGGFDLVFGHSSHHPKGIEVHNERLILYGAGDFLNDYEGIRDREDFRGDLVGLYLATFAQATGRLAGLEILPFRIRRFRLNHASDADTQWLAKRLDRECRRLGAGIVRGSDRRLSLAW